MREEEILKAEVKAKLNGITDKVFFYSNKKNKNQINLLDKHRTKLAKKLSIKDSDTKKP